MQPFTITKAATALDRDGISLSQTPGAAGDLTITGALASGGVATVTGGQQVVSVWSGSNIAARVFTIYGTNDNGISISETLTGVNNSTVSSILNYKTVTRIAVDAGTGAAVEAGITGVGSSPAFPLNTYVSPTDVALFVKIATGATVNCTVQYTSDDVFLLSNYQSSTGLVWIDHLVLASVTANADSNFTSPPTGVRLKINSGTDTAKLTIIQAGI